MRICGSTNNGFRISNHWAPFFMIASLFTAAAFAADVSVVVVDGQGSPVVDAVVALLPQAGASADSRQVRPDKTIDQINKQFRPSVLALQTGTLVYFLNSDNIRHQVYSFSDAKKFETKLYAGKTAPPVLFDKPGVVVLGCNIHDSMSAYLYVLDTPYFAKTDGAGSAVISAPAASYTINIWHPRYRKGRTPLSHEFTVTKSQESIYDTLSLETTLATSFAAAEEIENP